jgi:chromosome segregation and condensation protein ScpB
MSVAAEEALERGPRPSRELSELVAVVEALVFVADEPITSQLIADVLGADKQSIDAAVEQLKSE